MQNFPILVGISVCNFAVKTYVFQKSGTFGVPGLVTPGRGTAWCKFGTSREILFGGRLHRLCVCITVCVVFSTSLYVYLPASSVDMLFHIPLYFYLSLICSLDRLHILVRIYS